MLMRTVVSTGRCASCRPLGAGRVSSEYNASVPSDTEERATQYEPAVLAGARRSRHRGSLAARRMSSRNTLAEAPSGFMRSRTLLPRVARRSSLGVAPRTSDRVENANTKNHAPPDDPASHSRHY